MRVFSLLSDHLILLSLATLVSAHPAADAASGKDTRITPSFKPGANGLVHPGGVMGEKELAHLRKVMSRKDANTQESFQKLQESTRLSLQVQTRPVLATDWTSSLEAKESHRLFQKEAGEESYKQTIMFQITGNEQYAKNALKIISTWMAVNNGAGPSFTKKVSQENTPLVLAWTLANWLRSLEILKYTWSNWSANNGDATVNALLKWISAKQIDSVSFGDGRLLMSNQYSKNLPLANWHTSIIEAKLYLALLKDDKSGVDFVYNYYKRMIDGKKNQQGRSDKIYIGETGELFESCRDMDHASYNIGGLVQVAEAFHHQPKYNDLYLYNAQGESKPSNGLSGLENVLEMYATTVLTRKMPIESNGSTWVDRDVDVKQGFAHGPGRCKPKFLNWGQPMAGGYQMAYHHFVERLGSRKLPQLTAMAKQFPDSVYFHWGLGSLTHAGASK